MRKLFRNIFKALLVCLLLLPAFIYGGPGGKNKSQLNADSILFSPEAKWILDSIGCLGYRFDFNFHSRLEDYYQFHRSDILYVFGRPDVASEDGKIYEYWVKAPDLCGRGKSIEALNKLGYNPQQSVEFHFNDSFRVEGIFKKEY
jgi:hypothetical protein